jgi:hypothetical protein
MHLFFKQLITGIFIGLIFLGSFKEAAVYIVFKINQPYIVKNLCIERDIAESTCKGCCQLKEKINETRQQEPNVPNSQKQQKEISSFSFYLSHQRLTPMCNFRQIASTVATSVNNQYAYLSTCDCFHPPKTKV